MVRNNVIGNPLKNNILRAGMSFEIELSGTIALSLWSRILLSACFKSDSTVSSCRRRTSISWLFMSLIFDRNLENVVIHSECNILSVINVTLTYEGLDFVFFLVGFPFPFSFLAGLQ